MVIYILGMTASVSIRNCYYSLKWYVLEIELPTMPRHRNAGAIANEDIK